jgi:hemoglobin
MRFLILATILLIALCTVESQTICTKYSRALRVTNKFLVELVVNTSVANIFNPTSGLRRYFDGTHPNQTINYTNNVPALNVLRVRLVTFFGAALGCEDGTIGPYQGRSMDDAHRRLSIDFFAHSQFNRIVVNVLAGAGVSKEDQKAVAQVLDSLRPSICLQSDCMSICNSYSIPTIADNVDLVGAVVDGTVGKALGSANLKRFFDGTQPPFSTNYTSDPVSFSILRNHLIEFFGAALGCSDRTIGIYNGRSLKDAHRGMGVGLASFKEFNNAVVSVMASAGVKLRDQQAVAGVLESTRCDICTLGDCGC